MIEGDRKWEEKGEKKSPKKCNLLMTFPRLRLGQLFSKIAIMKELFMHFTVSHRKLLTQVASMSPKCYFSTLTRFVARFVCLAKLVLRIPHPGSQSQSSVNKSVCCLNLCYFSHLW